MRGANYLLLNGDRRVAHVNPRTKMITSVVDGYEPILMHALT